jgi:hypothetical protein
MSKVEKMVKKNYELSKKLTPENDAVYTDADPTYCQSLVHLLD